MIGACFNLSTFPSNVKPVPASATFHGRNLTFLPPGFPRISRSTSFWSAFRRGGFDGLRQSFVRTLDEYHLSDLAKAEKTSKASLYLLATLKSSTNSPEWRKNLAAALHEANWLEVDIKSIVQLALIQMTDDERNELINACDKESTTPWLSTEISKFKEDVNELKIEFFGSAFLALRGTPLTDPKQQERWKKIDNILMFDGDLKFSHKAAKIVSNNIMKLLPFLRNDSANGQDEPKSLKVFREQLVNKLKILETIDLADLSEADLQEFGAFAIGNQLGKHLSAYNKECGMRQFAVKAAALETHFHDRVVALMSSSSVDEGGRTCNLLEENFKEFNESQRSAIAFKATKNLSPETLVALSKMSFNRTDDACLVGAAIQHINEPNVKAMRDDRLIAFLKMAEEELLPAFRSSLLEEAKARIALANRLGFESLEKGLTSGSCGDLVRAVWEFSALDSIARELKAAINLDDGPMEMPKEFLEMFKSIDTASLMRVKKLRLCLIENGNAEVATLLTSVLRERPGESWVEPTSRDNQSIENAVSHYFPTKKTQSIVPAAGSGDIKLGARVLDRLNQTLFLQGIPEMKKAKDGTLVPVCGEFAKDQRNIILRINGCPILLSNLPGESEQEREFVYKMKELGNVTDNQIMTASYICTQSVANTLSDLAISEGILPFNDEEMEKTRVRGKYRWGLQGDLTRDPSFIMGNAGNVIATVRISSEKLKTGTGYSLKGDSVTCTLDPENSFFLTELVMKIKPNGEICECKVTKFEAKREILEVV